MNIQELAKKIKEAVATYNTSDEYNRKGNYPFQGKEKVTIWEKYGKQRIYVDGFHSDKSFYYDVIENNVVPSRQGASSDAINIFKIANIESYKINNK